MVDHVVHPVAMAAGRLLLGTGATRRTRAQECFLLLFCRAELEDSFANDTHASEEHPARLDTGPRGVERTYSALILR